MQSTTDLTLVQSPAPATAAPKASSVVKCHAPTNWMDLTEEWASDRGYRLIDDGPARRTYQKARGFLVAPMKVELSESRGQLTVSAWIAPTFLARLMALFMLPATMGVQSGGLRGVLPRKMARDAVNALLRTFGAPTIG